MDVSRQPHLVRKRFRIREPMITRSSILATAGILSSNLSVSDRENIRQQIAADTDAFMTAGGKIKRL